MADSDKFFKEMSGDELAEIESQLSFPSGEAGKEMALAMNESNISMTRAAIEAMELKNNCCVLELGHGNCAHLSELFEKCETLKFCGLEISETMKSEAERLNKQFKDSNGAEFHLYDGTKFPFQDDQFNRFFTVNTIYFWNDPQQTLAEIHRVLSEDGIAAIAFGQKRFMEQLPFVNDKFSLFDNDKISRLIDQSPFHLKGIHNFSEEVKSKSGDTVDRHFSIARLSAG